MKRRKKEDKEDEDESDTEDSDIDNDNQVDERHVQVNSNDPLLTNEYVVKNEAATEIETEVSSRPVLIEPQPSVRIITGAESKSENTEPDQESSKPVHTAKRRKKVEFVIELPVTSS